MVMLLGFRLYRLYRYIIHSRNGMMIRMNYALTCFENEWEPEPVYDRVEAS